MVGRSIKRSTLPKNVQPYSVRMFIMFLNVQINLDFILNKY